MLSDRVAALRREEDEVLTGETFRGETVEDLDLSDLEFTDVTFEKCRFVNCRFGGSSFYRVSLEGCDFSNFYRQPVEGLPGVGL